MPFGLKRTRVTYQWAIGVLFQNMMHEEIEVYTNDIIAKIRHDENQLETLRKLFDHLRELKLWFNPMKCMFGATIGKLLNFIVTNRGIEVDPFKIKVMCDLRPPSTIKEIYNLLAN